MQRGTSRSLAIRVYGCGTIAIRSTKECNDAHGNKRRKEHLMFDVVMLALGLGFFVAGIGYAYACERL